LRHNRVLLANAIVLLPVLVPTVLAILTVARYPDAGRDIFLIMMEQVYLKAMAPLLALFFGCMLVGEDVEMDTMAYVQTRPVPRSAWVLGRFASYLVVSLGMLLGSEVLMYLACSGLGGIDMTAKHLLFALRYAGATAMAVVGYGALCALLGALVRWPVVVGVVFLFGWQRLANLVPGLVDFLTIEKYLTALLPAMAVSRKAAMIRTSLVSFNKQEMLISGPRALITLGCITLALLCLTVYVVRRREYASGRAVGS